MTTPASTRRPQRCGLLHITGPLKESHRRTLVRKLVRAANTRAGRDLGKLAGYAADGDGLLVATSSDRLAMYLGLSLEQTRRRAVFGLTPGGLVYVRVEQRDVPQTIATRQTPRRLAA